MHAIVDLKSWLRAQELTVRALALEVEVPLKTAQDWVYRGVAPSADNRDRLSDYIFSHCAHHWVIAVPNGPTSEGVCQRCGHQREFVNSVENSKFQIGQAPNRFKRSNAATYGLHHPVSIGGKPQNDAESTQQKDPNR